MFCHLLFASILQYIIIPSHTLSNVLLLNESGRNTGPMVPERVYFDEGRDLRFRPDEHGCNFFHSHAALNPSNIHHKDTIPAPTAKVHDPSTMAAFPTVSAHQHRARATSRRAVRFPHTRRATGRELIRSFQWRGQSVRLARTTTRDSASDIWSETQEETLEIEYIESVMPPSKLATLPHEEWVSSISCFVPGSAPFSLP